MKQAGEHRIYWRRKPIDTLDTRELRSALGEAITGLLSNSEVVASQRRQAGHQAGGEVSQESFIAGAIAGMAAGVLLTLGTLLVLAVF